MAHGISVWLCGVHSSEAFLGEDGGEAFAARIRNAWRAAGCLTARRIEALATHIRQHRSAAAAVQRDQPGSYSWPRLRREAERRFAAGEDPRTVIAALRALHADGPANAPSARTMRRWYTDARWLTGPTGPRRRERPPKTHRRPVPPNYLLLPAWFTDHLLWCYNEPRPRGP